MRPSALLACALAALALAAPARAHDTWFEAAADGTLRLGTGTLFPKRETAIDPVYLRHQGCRDADGRTAPLRAGPLLDDALLLSVPAGAVSCWMQLTPFEIELAPDKIGLYLSEVRPPPELLRAWEALHARGLPWRERYVKHARIDLGPGPFADQPAGLGLEALLDSGGETPRAGRALALRVLRDGRPLPGFAIQLRSELTPAGFWLRADAQGRLTFTPPLPGRWLARGVDLRVADDDPERFDSRFVTLAFDVAPRKAAP